MQSPVSARRFQNRRSLSLGMLLASVASVGLAASAFAAGSGAAKPTASQPVPASRPVPAAQPAPATAAATSEAIFAGGCFWCVESAFQLLPGVKSVESGFSGGNTPNPTYDQVSAGKTTHAEAVRVVFDPAVVSYAKLLDVFWHNIDPTQPAGQFCDVGAQYRTAIFYRDENQQRLALESKQKIDASKQLRKPIVTEIVAFKSFWPAEEYHQDFFEKDPFRYASYRTGCGRDARLKEIWGEAAAAHP